MLVIMVHAQICMEVLGMACVPASVGGDRVLPPAAQLAPVYPLQSVTWDCLCMLHT
jgi:hypothetical protein